LLRAQPGHDTGGSAEGLHAVRRLVGTLEQKRDPAQGVDGLHVHDPKRHASGLRAVCLGL